MKILPLVISTLPICLAATVPAQASRNVTLKSNYRPSNSGGSYNDIWGYRDPNTGKEYALLGSYAGTHVIDCSVPTSPQDRGRIATGAGGSGNTWRDMKTFGHYAYIVSEAHGGMQIVDLANPDSPQLVGTVGNWTHAHNIGMDPGTGIAYPCGTNRGVLMMDCASNPTNPSEIGRFASPYIHDLAVENGFAWFCAQNEDELRIYDARTIPTLTEFARVRLPGSQIAHNCWPSKDGDVCATTNETSSGPVTVFWTANKRAPQQVATYRANPSTAPQAIPHNVYIRDRVMHMSHYTEGYRAVDISDPSNPVEVGYYDTWPGSSGGYNGAWGCYHEALSGHVYISDISTGLYVLKPKALSARIGEPTLGTGGAETTLHPVGAAFKGNANFGFRVFDAQSSVAGVLLISPNQVSVTLQGLNIHVDLGPGLIALPFTTGAAGRHSVNIPVSTTISSGKIYAQALVTDAGSSSLLGLSSTRAVEVEIFDR